MRKASGFLLAAALVLGIAAAPTISHAAAAPVIENTGSLQWLESLAITDGNASGRGTGKNTTITLVVKHDPSVSVTGLAIDDDWNGSDDTATVAPKTDITVEHLPGLDRSRVTYTWLPPRPSGFGCTIGGNTTRRQDLPLRVRVVTSDDQRSAPVSRNVHIVEDDDCTGIEDYGHVWNQSQSATTGVPGTTVSFTFTGDDRDTDAWSGYKWRVRKLNTGGFLVGGPTDGIEVTFGNADNQSKTQAVTFTERGRFVVEVLMRSRLCPLGICGSTHQYQDNSTNGWWRLGAVDINSAAAASPTAAISAPASVVVGDSFPASAAVADSADASAGGRAAVIEWDTDNDGLFDTQVNAADPAAGLTEEETTIEIDTSAAMPGPFVVSARVTDNGALSAADSIRRQSVATITVELTNEDPIADDQTVETDEDTAVAITLTGSDPDGHAITFAVDAAPTHGALTGDAPELTYTPAANYFGDDSFTFTVSDPYGGVGTGTVSITVNPVNDAPVADGQAVETDEDTAVEVTLTGSDVEDDPLTFTVVDGPTHGILSGEGATLTYTPAANYFGDDSFTFIANDGELDSEAATVSITVGPVNDAPVAHDQTVETQQEAPVAIVLTGSDVEDDPLTFTVVSGPEHGSLSGEGANLTYTPEDGYTGADSFTFIVNDGDLDSEPATVAIGIGPLFPTAVTANPAVADLQSGGVYLTLSATLTRTDTDQVLAGETIVFSIGGDEICRAVTDSGGSASCGELTDVVSVILNGSYTASFDKRPPYAASASSNGAIVF